MEISRASWWSRLVSAGPHASRARTDAALRQEERARRELARQQRKAEHAARRLAVKAAKQQAETDGARRRRAEEDRAAAEQAAARQIAARAFEAYVTVRDSLRQLRQGADSASCSAAERDVVSALMHLWQADPQTIACLRRWCAPITGVRATDYEPPSPELTLRIKREYRVLRQQVGTTLFVPESPALGGFGCVRNGQLVNVDTLKYFSALVALEDGAVLQPCRAPAGRPLVWEIGGGWGGFAYQFKTVCPNVTYVITGVPEQLLVSAVYVMTLCPHARCRVYDPGDPQSLWREWEQVDFVFAPESALAASRPPRLDLTLDIMALVEMDDDRVRWHVRRAFELESPYFYSLLPAAGDAAGASRVAASLERLYWPHPVPPRAERMPPVVDGVADAPPDVDYVHLVGWRRLRA